MRFLKAWAILFVAMIALCFVPAFIASFVNFELSPLITATHSILTNGRLIRIIALIGLMVAVFDWLMDK